MAEGRTPGFLRSETGVRVVSGLVLVAAALGACVAGGFALAAFWFLAAAGAAVEWTAVARIERRRAVQAVLVGSVAVASSLAALGIGGAPAVAAAAVAILAVLVAARGSRDRLWAVAGLAAACVLATTPVLVREHPALGLVGLLWMFAVVWGTDVAAYFAGRAFGGPKLWPQVSPKKTWSGFVGGLAAGTGLATLVVAAAQAQGVEIGLGYGALVALAALASIVGQIGDLAESALKRRFAVKDSSHLIPGHGGVMDRIDAFFAVCCLAALYLLAEAVGAA